MKMNNSAFTLIEILVTLSITSILLLIIGGIYPTLIQSFWEQKENLEFQQSFILDNFYLNSIITHSQNILSNYSSWNYQRRNSYLTLLGNKGNFHYSMVYLWDDEGNILSETGEKLWKLNVKNTFLYSNFVSLWDDVYFTNPWKHTIEKYLSWAIESQVIYGISWIFWYDTTGSGKFNTPTGITTDGSNLYVADTGNNVIRRINLATNSITTIAGKIGKSGFNDGETFSTGTLLNDSLFDYPTSLAYENNSLYVSDTYNNRVRKIDFWANKIFTLAGSDNRWFNLDQGLSEQVLIHHPLALIKTSSGIIFWDVTNGKIRFLNETTNELKTIVWIETLKEENTLMSKYKKIYFNSNLQLYSSWFYFNDMSKGIIYDYNFWWDGQVWWVDDTIKNIFWKEDKNLLKNGDFEYLISSLWAENDIEISDNDLFYTSGNDFIYPIFWNKYWLLNTLWKKAKGSISFLNNPSDGEIIQISDKIFEFDNNGSVSLWSILVPIGLNLNMTLENLQTELGNYDRVNTLSGNILYIEVNEFWTGGNSVVFSWGTSVNYSFFPNTGTLTWGETYGSGTFSFRFTKNLQLWEKYSLSFYIASDKILESDTFSPLMTVKTGTGNMDEKIFHLNEKWTKKEFIFDGKWENQVIEFQCKYWQKIYIDNIQLYSIWKTQSFNDLSLKKNIQFWYLPSFFIVGEKYFLTDIENKKIVLLVGDSLKYIQNDFSFFDILTLKANYKNDYLWNSLMELLHYEKNKNNIMYMVWKWDYFIKLSNNIAKKWNE